MSRSGFINWYLIFCVCMYILSSVCAWSNEENALRISWNTVRINCNLKLSFWTSFPGDQKYKIVNKNKIEGTIKVHQGFSFYFNSITSKSTFGDSNFILSYLLLIYWKKYKVSLLMVLINAGLFAHLFKEHYERNFVIFIMIFWTTATFYGLMSKVTYPENPILY